MKLSLLCTRCHASFVVAGDPPPKFAACPECGQSHRVPSVGNTPDPQEGQMPGSAQMPGEGISVFIPATPPPLETRKPRRWGVYAASGLCLLLIAGALSSWPWLRERFWEPESKDPVERVARSYLEALVREDSEEVRRLGTVEDTPAIRSFGEVARTIGREQSMRGKFGPIARFNKKIDETFNYDPKLGRFTPKNPLGPAADVLDTLHEAKELQEKSGITDRLVGGSEHENLDAAVEFGEQQTRMIGKLVEGVLAPKKLIPTYAMLVKEARPPLPDNEKELALDYAENRESWDALLKRPFLSLKADGPFVLDRAEVKASVHDRLASLGDPPSILRLKLVRFRLEGIDTGWKVIAAERVSEEPEGDEASHSSLTDTGAGNRDRKAAKEVPSSLDQPQPRR